MPDTRYRLITVRMDHGVLVMTISHAQLRSTEFDVVEALRVELLQALAAAKTAKVVVDMSEVEQVGSASFRPLLTLRRKLKETGGHLLLCGLQSDVREVFEVTGLIDADGTSAATFGVASDASSAVARLNASN